MPLFPRYASRFIQPWSSCNASTREVTGAPSYRQYGLPTPPSPSPSSPRVVPMFGKAGNPQQRGGSASTLDLSSSSESQTASSKSPVQSPPPPADITPPPPLSSHAPHGTGEAFSLRREGDAPFSSNASSFHPGYSHHQHQPRRSVSPLRHSPENVSPYGGAVRASHWRWSPPEAYAPYPHPGYHYQHAREHAYYHHPAHQTMHSRRTDSSEYYEFREPAFHAPQPPEENVDGAGSYPRITPHDVDLVKKSQSPISFTTPSEEPLKTEPAATSEVHRPTSRKLASKTAKSTSSTTKISSSTSSSSCSISKKYRPTRPAKESTADSMDGVEKEGATTGGEMGVTEDGDDRGAVMKRMRNTEAARRSRAKKMARMDMLEVAVEKLEGENARLVVQLAVMESERASWRVKQAEYIF
ncbi:hypothetical protein HDU67_009531 [Dinochytrium kinnereticum]|nr:hypothetical protein HDU67_009531 [Dinochytrium kinnereticum]